MKRLTLGLIYGIVCGLAACAPATPTVVIPTLADLPSATPPLLTTVTLTAPPTVTPEPPTEPPTQAQPTPPEQLTLDAIVTELTLESAELATGLAGATNTAAALTPNADAQNAGTTPTVNLTLTPTAPAPGSLEFVTFTPSDTLDVTYTPAPSRTATGTPTPAPEGLALLALLAGQFTVLPPEIRYNEPTRTALAAAMTAVLLTDAAPTPLPGQPAPGAPINPNATLNIPSVGNQPIIPATLPPPIGSAPLGTAQPCVNPPPGAINAVLAAEPALSASLGCPIGAAISTSAASQPFERGTMIYVAGAPGDILVLTSAARFRRYADTWTSGVDPESTGLIPPAGLLEPIRGFGKVWRTNTDVFPTIGWATGGESGTTASLLLFDRGRAIYLPSTNTTYLLINDAGTTETGSWRSFSGGF
ncbi:MAG: hypothetical protein SF162_13825 [bacterium]|nr:hypothetical protein [bacterium]